MTGSFDEIMDGFPADAIVMDRIGMRQMAAVARGAMRMMDLDMAKYSDPGDPLISYEVVPDPAGPTIYMVRDGVRDASHLYVVVEPGTTGLAPFGDVGRWLSVTPAYVEFIANFRVGSIKDGRGDSALMLGHLRDLFSAAFPGHGLGPKWFDVIDAS